MDKRSDDIRQDIEDTRASLTEKLDLLQDKATEVVDQTKQIFDVKTQVGERPWVALGVAIAAGYVLGSLGGDDDKTPSYSQNYNQNAYSGPSTMDTVKSKSRDFLSQFDDEIDLLKTAAITTLTTFVRDAAREAVPALGPQIEQLLNQRGSSSGSTSSSYTSNTYGSSSYSSGSDSTSGSSGLTRTSSPNSSMDYEENAGKVNNDAMPQMNRYGNPPPTPNRDDQDYYTTYQPGEDQRTVGGQ